MSAPSVPLFKRCIKCGEEKPATAEFWHKDNSKPDRLRVYCKRCRQTPLGKHIEDDRASWPTGHRRCTSCNEIKPLEMFSPDARNSIGTFSWCKVCHAAISRSYYHEHSEERKAYSREWNRRNQERVKEYAHIYHQANKGQRNAKSSEWRRSNPDKAKENNRRWHEEHREQRREQHKKWREENRSHIRDYMIRNRLRYNAHVRRAIAMHPDRYRAYKHAYRARIASIGGVLTAGDIAHISHIQQGICAYCGRHGVKLEIEHIIPVTREGSSNDPWNICLACKSCNSSKQDKLLEEWVDRWYFH